MVVSIVDFKQIDCEDEQFLCRESVRREYTNYRALKSVNPSER